MSEIAEYYRIIDASMEQGIMLALHKGGYVVRCPTVPGCDGCCHEQAIISDAEIDYMLDGLSVEQVSDLTLRTEQWVAEVKAKLGGLHRDLKTAFEYRSHGIACPFLVDHKCSVYSRRPAECRSYFTFSDPACCTDMSLRPSATFFAPMQFMLHGMKHLVSKYPHVILDHIGNLLAERLLGIRLESAVRVEFADGEFRNVSARPAESGPSSPTESA